MFSFDRQINIGTDTFATDGMDLLGRADFGKRLSELMERDTQPLVVALDGAWGAGKSHFLQLWTGTHNQTRDHNAKVIYFDAFAQDYLDDPLISLVAAISRAEYTESGKVSKTLSRLKAWGIKLVKPAARASLALATAGVTELAMPVLDNLADAFIKEGSKEAERAIDDLWKREEGRIAAVEGFRTALEDLAGEEPLILVIDELDRCRPDYALTLLEVVKHFFLVKGVRFVLGVNLEALEHSVRQRYGAGVDAGLYLQKFLHLRVLLPYTGSSSWGPHWDTYFHKLAARNAISPRSYNDASNLLACIDESRRVTLREVERIAARLALLRPRGGRDSDILAFISICAVILETLSIELYRKFRKGTISLAEVSDFFAFGARALSTDQHGGQFRKESVEIWREFLASTDPRLELSGGADGIGDLTGKRHRADKMLSDLRDILDTFARPPAR